MLRDVMLPQKKKTYHTRKGRETETSDNHALFKKRDRAESYVNAAARWYVS